MAGNFYLHQEDCDGTVINEAVGAVPDGGEKFGAQNSDDQFWSYLIKEVRK